MNIRTMIFLMMLVLTTSLSAWSQQVAEYRVIPMPQSIAEQKDESFVLDGNTTIVYVGNNQISADNDEAMRRNTRYLRQYIHESTGIETGIVYHKVKNRPTIQLSIDPKIIAQEGYQLTITKNNVIIAGATPQGVFYGIQTLRKSIPMQATGSVELPAVAINDQPRFAYRGMHLDCARHFFSVNKVKTFIDMLALHNMNRFHWHLTDDQGWRIEIKKYPRLTEFGSRRTGTVIGNNSDVDDKIPYGGFYTQEEVKDVISYAAERYITIIPEIDMPGHTLAALACFPELGCTGGPYEVGHKWGVGYDVFCVGNPKSLEFAKNVLTEVMELFPSEIIHIGGDEAPTKRWDDCPKCKALNVASIQGYFTHELEDFLAIHGRKAIGWDEMLEHGVASNTEIMSWRGSKPGYQAAAAGHDVVMSPLTHCYLDYYQTKDTRYEPSVTGMWPINVAKVYSFDAAPDSIPAETREHIIGVQGNIWTEHIPNFDVVQYQALPRMSALAEVQWTYPERKDYKLFKERLTRFTKIYEFYNWTYAKHLWPERMTQDRWHF